MNIFHSEYKERSNKELQDIVNNHFKFQDDAVVAAIDILTEREVKLSPEQEAIKITTKTKTAPKDKKRPEKTMGQALLPALLIDLAVLSIISYLLGFILIYISLANEYTTLAASAILIIAYFSFGNSKLFDGATVGKKSMKLKVVNHDNSTISIQRSTLRTLLIIGPFFIFKYLDIVDTDSIILDLAILIFKTIYFTAIIYFYIIDKKLKRSYSDLLLKTFIIRADKSSDYTVFPRKFSYYFTAIAVSIVVICTLSNISLITDSKDIPETEQPQLTTLNNNVEVFKQIINEIKNIEGVSKINGFTLNTTNNIRTDLIISVQTEFIPINDKSDGFADKIYSTLIGKTFNIERLDNVKIVLKSGFNMTLATYDITNEKTYKQ